MSPRVLVTVNGHEEHANIKFLNLTKLRMQLHIAFSAFDAVGWAAGRASGL